MVPTAQLLYAHLAVSSLEGLPVNGYNLVHLTRYAMFFLAGGICFAKKELLIVGPYFQILAFHILVQLTIQDEQVFLNKHGSKTLIIQQYYHHHIPFVTLCGKSVKQSHCP